MNSDKESFIEQKKAAGIQNATLLQIVDHIFPNNRYISLGAERQSRNLFSYCLILCQLFPFSNVQSFNENLFHPLSLFCVEMPLKVWMTMPSPFLNLLGQKNWKTKSSSTAPCKQDDGQGRCQAGNYLSFLIIYATRPGPEFFFTSWDRSGYPPGKTREVK